MSGPGRPIRLLYLAVQPPGVHPSQRFRFEAFQPFLERNGVVVDYAWILSHRDRELFYGRHAAPVKAWVVLRSVARRLASLAPLPGRVRPDVVFVQREAAFIGGAWAERIAAARAPVVYDFDDAIWIPIVSEGNRRFAFLKNVAKFPRIMGLARTVIAGNEHLAEYARRHSRHVQVIPTAVDTDRFAPAPRPPGGPVVIGWSGSRSTLVHLREVLPALRRLRERFGDAVRFEVVGDGTFRDDSLGIQGREWSAEAEVRLLQGMDVGLMPLTDDAWARGKCGFKALTYMAVGIPPVVSPVGVNTQIVTPGVDGLWASSTDEWVEAMTTLVTDAPLRRRLGAAAREKVVRDYSVARWQEALLAVIRDAVASPAG